MSWFLKKKKIEVLSPLDGYNRWASHYHIESNPIKDLSDKLVEQMLPDLKDKAVLDAGCGTGKFCLEAEKQNAARVFGIDLSPSMIEKARETCEYSEFRCEDLSVTVLADNSFDVVICALVLGHIEHLSPSLDSLLKSLKPGGIVIITDFHPFLTLIQSRRTFQDRQTGRSFEVRHYLHLIQDYFECFRQNNCVVEKLQEPMFNGVPVVFGFQAKKS